MAGYTTNDQGICAFNSESTYGTDAFSGSAPAAANCFPAAECMIKQVREQVEGGRLTATVAGECHGIHKSHTEVTLNLMLLGSAAAGDVPPIGPILQAAGMSETVDAGVSVTYTPEVTQQDSITVLHYQRNVNDGNARRIMARGVRGNVTITMAVGQEAMVEFSGQGLYNDLPASDATFPTLPDEYAGDQCAWVVNTLALTVGGTTYPIEEMSFTTPWTVELIRTGDSTGGGTTGAVLLMNGKEGSRFGGGFTLVDGATALTAAINLVQGGAKASLSAVLTKGSRTITISAAAVQLGVDLDDQSPRYALQWFAVRADGETGANHVEIVFA